MSWRDRSYADDDDDSDQTNDPEAPDESDMDDGDDPELVDCPYCRKEILEETDICPHCGNFISKEDAPFNQPLWLTIAAILALAGFCAVWLTMR